MAVKNVGGHGVTSVLKGTDHVAVNAAQPQFSDAPTGNGGQGYGAPTVSSKKKAGFPPAK